MKYFKSLFLIIIINFLPVYACQRVEDLHSLGIWGSFSFSFLEIFKSQPIALESPVLKENEEEVLFNYRKTLHPSERQKEQEKNFKQTTPAFDCNISNISPCGMLRTQLAKKYAQKL